MTRTLFLAPHNDDETLFGAFTIMRFAPVVAVVFKSAKQAPAVTSDERELETALAVDTLGAERWEQWPIADTTPERQARQAVQSILETQRTEYEHVFAPAPVDGGHEQHSLVGNTALDVFGSDRVTLYHTYRRGEGRTTSQWEIPFEPAWPSVKLLALSCYLSQIRHPSTAAWFLELLPMREYVAHEPKIAAPAGERDPDEFLAENIAQMQRFAALRDVM